jgi:hypothetical protein
MYAMAIIHIYILYRIAQFALTELFLVFYYTIQKIELPISTIPPLFGLVTNKLLYNDLGLLVTTCLPQAGTNKGSMR